MNITIVGGGNVGTQFAVHCAASGHKVKIFTSKPELFHKRISIVNRNRDVLLSGEIVLATNNANEAFASADLIFITVPAFCADEYSKIIVPWVKEGAYIGFIPGTGGMECAFRSCIEKGCIIFGLQRVPSVARLIEYGKTVCAEGYRGTLHLSAMPNVYTEECCKIINQIFGIDCQALPNFLNLTLTPSNPILHTSRLYSLFKDYYNGKVYKRVPLFYEEWDNDSSDLLLKLDDEVQGICKLLNSFDLSCVKSLKEHYESKTIQQLTDKIRSIQSFKGLKTPIKEVEGGYIPDLSSRYFTADFPYGLYILFQIAQMIQYEVPNIEMVIKWYFNLVKKEDAFHYSDYAINDINEFEKFYKL